MTPKQMRGLKRLRALGVDPSQADLASVRQFYEDERERYISLAVEGLHFAPTHALYGMMIDALKDYYEWTQLPDGWTPPHPQWPGPLRSSPQ